MSTPQTTASLSLKNILFATDFSAASELAFPFVKALARRYGSTVYVAHAYPPETVYPMSLEPLAPQLARQRPAAKAQLSAFLQSHDFTPLAHRELLWEGDAGLALSAIITNNEIDLVIVGTHGRTGFKYLLQGSVAEELVRRCQCPVLTVGPHVLLDKSAGVGEFRSVLYATDFSPASENALVYALLLAEENQGDLMLLHVVREPSVDALMPYPWAEIAAAQQRLRDLLPEGADLCCQARFLAEVGVPGQVILHVARAQAANLIVMGAHHTAMPRASAHASWRTVHHIICEATCPVLTCGTEEACTAAKWR
jgi:nucleotide-binding universal stress UspA family protein